MSKLRTPFRYDYVGSFLRPQSLKDAKADFKAGKITTAQLREIAEYKMPDLNANDVEAAMRIIAGTAKNMGIEVVD